MTTLFTHPQQFSWLTLFFLSSLSFVIRCIVAPTDPEDKIVSELSFETSMVGAKITEEQLSAQDPSNTLEYWKTPGNRPIRTCSSLLWKIIFRCAVILSFSSISSTKMHTEGYAKLWDETFSIIQSFFGNHDKCTKANNIISELVGSASFELIKRAAKEKNARTSKRLSDLAEIGEHPWQQPEFINAHTIRTSK